MPLVRSSEPIDVGSSPGLPMPIRVPGARDERLRLARRIDWRFLLDAPELGNVQVAGDPDEDLMAALSAAIADEAHGSTLVRTGRGGPAAETVILAGARDRHDLAAAAEAVGPGGRLVVELDGPLRLGGRRSIRLGRPGAAVRVARTLRAAGWSVRIWWAWPDRGRATAWAATDDAAAIRALLARRLGQGPLDAISRLASTHGGRRAIELAGPAVTLVARRGEDRPSFVESRLDGGPAARTAGARPGLLVLTPRYRASAHVVALSIDASPTVLRHVVKLARLPDDRGLDHEGAVLAALVATARDDGRWPAPLSTGSTGSAWPVLVERALPGRPLAPDVVRTDRDGAIARIRAMLDGLPVADPRVRVVPVADRLATALATIEDVDPMARTDLSSLVRRSRSVLAVLHDAPLPVVFEHGDAAHPNLIELPDGRLGAVDWERGEPDGLPLHDLTIALAYVAAAARGATGSTGQAAAFTDAMRGTDAWAAVVLDDAVVRLGVEPRLRAALVVAAWARSVAWLATATGASPDKPDSVEWLAADRAAGLWRASLTLAEDQ